MGIAGAGLVSSTIAEIVAFVVFFLYILSDRTARSYHLFRLPKIDLKLIRQQYSLSLPIVAQAFVGLGSWFVFFGIVENLGESELWYHHQPGEDGLSGRLDPDLGFASGVNTLVSHFIGTSRNGRQWCPSSGKQPRSPGLLLC
ncbi:MAG: hypothetical protein H6559_34720 [Lewinellaceae bacterium]|nr:hypothetical protein [Lewinellaceae bacterium]